MAKRNICVTTAEVSPSGVCGKLNRSNRCLKIDDYGPTATEARSFPGVPFSVAFWYEPTSLEMEAQEPLRKAKSEHTKPNSQRLQRSEINNISSNKTEENRAQKQAAHLHFLEQNSAPTSSISHLQDQEHHHKSAITTQEPPQEPRKRPHYQGGLSPPPQEEPPPHTRGSSTSPPHSGGAPPVTRGSPPPSPPPQGSLHQRLPQALPGPPRSPRSKFFPLLTIARPPALKI
ncbi:formin-A-like [Lagopus muta]|uniref:formin-A-like n=1 Tax=Lagopus muta TaxID=64668 RepID=UPI00209D9CBF|nr:formin-A-like [Lagopus muta]